MKETPNNKRRSRRQRKSKNALKRLQKELMLPGVLSCSPPVLRHGRYTLRSHNRNNVGKYSNYLFNITDDIKRHLQTIKRVVINDPRTTSNYRILRRGSTKLKFRGGYFKEDFNWLPLRCSQTFLANRSFKMSNKGLNSKRIIGNIKITCQQMLNIRKKRKNFLHQLEISQTKRQPEPERKENAEYIPLTVNIEDNSLPAKIEDVSLPVNIKDNLLPLDIKAESNNNEATKFAVNSVEVNTNKNKEEEESIDIIDLDSTPVNDSKVCNASGAFELQTDQKEVEGIRANIDESVIVVAEWCPANAPEDGEVSFLNGNNTVTVPDTSENVNDSDIIFVSDNSNFRSASKKRKLNQKSPIIILDDDDDTPVKKNRRITRSTTRLSRLSLTSRRCSTRLAKKRKKNKIKEDVANKIEEMVPLAATSATKISNTGIREFANCADVNCVNTTNHKKNSATSGQSCACEPNTSVSKPNNNTSPTFDFSNFLPRNNNNKISNMTNIYNTRSVVRTGLREIIIDGSNVAIGHSHGRSFSVTGLAITIEYFLKRGHKVRAFVPKFRLKRGQSSDPKLLQILADKKYVVFTPSREVENKRITPYDDRYIIQYATMCEGIVVSNDNFRDLLHEKPEWRKTIKTRILMYTWVDNVLIFPDDPLGRYGPTLSRFLRFP